jgi:hypothetical protein
MVWVKRRHAPLLPKGKFPLNERRGKNKYDNTHKNDNYRAYVTIADLNEERGKQVAEELSPSVCSVNFHVRIFGDR